MRRSRQGRVRRGGTGSVTWGTSGSVSLLVGLDPCV
jgi:hypothetical protein